MAVMALLIAGCNQGNGSNTTAGSAATDSEKIEKAWKEAVNGNAQYMVTVDLKEAKKSIKADGFNDLYNGISTANDLSAKKDVCTMKVVKIGTAWAEVDEFCKGGLATEWTFFMKKEGSDWKAPVVAEK